MTLARISGAVLIWWRFIMDISFCRSLRMPWTTRLVRLNSVWMSSPPCSFRSPNPTLSFASCCTAWSSRRWSSGVTFWAGNILRVCTHKFLNTEIWKWDDKRKTQQVKSSHQTKFPVIIKENRWCISVNKTMYCTYAMDVVCCEGFGMVDTMVYISKLQENILEVASCWCSLAK